MATLLFEDQFVNFNPVTTPNWNTRLAWGNGTDPANASEAQQYVNVQAGDTRGPNPFSTTGGILSITATPTAGLTNGKTYTSGVLTTYQKFFRTYGYWEISCKLPGGTGFWPAFWLMPNNVAQPLPELDIMEAASRLPNEYSINAHWNDGSGQIAIGDEEGYDTNFIKNRPDLRAGFHRFGLWWTDKFLRYYFDGVMVFQRDTPPNAQFNTDHYMIINLACATSGWQGTLDGSTQTMQVDYVRVYDTFPTNIETPTWPPSGLPTTATHLYVNVQTGNDTTGTGTAGAPYKSIGKAKTVATAGTTVHVASGIYRESIAESSSDPNGTAANPIIFLSDVQWGAKIYPPSNSATDMAWAHRGDYVQFIGFEVDGASYDTGTVTSAPTPDPYPSVPVTNTHRYVNGATGSDTSGNGTQGAPWKTIGKAAATVAAGTTVHIADGTYFESPAVYTNGTSANPIIFLADNKWGVKLKQNAPSAHSEEGCWLVRGAYVYVVGVEIEGTGYGGSAPWRMGIILGGSNSVAKFCKVHHIHQWAATSQGGGGIMPEYWWAGVDQVVDSCLVYNIGNYPSRDSLVHGIYFSGQCKIYNNVVHSCSGVGITGWHSAHDTLISNNLVFNCNFGIDYGAGDSRYPGSNYGTPYTGPAVNITVQNNICVYNAQRGIQQEGSVGSCITRNNLFWNNTGGNITLISGNTHSGTLQVDPQFVTWNLTGSGDYHLQSSSPCIGAGTSTLAPTRDYDRYVRPQGGTVDIGPYEYVVSTTTPVGGTRWRFGVYVTGTNAVVSDCKVLNIQTTDNGTVGGAGIYADSYYNKLNQTIERNIVLNVGSTTRSTSLHGIKHSGTGAVLNNLVGDVSGTGVQLMHSARNVLIANNTVFNTLNAAYHIKYLSVEAYNGFAGPISGVTVQNNIGYRCQYGIFEEGTVGANTYRYNCLSTNTNGNQIISGNTVQNNSTADPQFGNYIKNGRGNYRPLVTSPCVNTGIASVPPVVDIEGYARPVGSAYDIGAFEYLVEPTAGTPTASTNGFMFVGI